MPKLIVEQDAIAPRGPNITPENFGAGVGRAVQQAGQQVMRSLDTFTAYNKQKARRRSAEFGQALEAEFRQIELDNDLEHGDERRAEATKRLTKKYRGGALGVFDAESSISAQGLENRYGHRGRLRQIEAGQHDLSETLRIYADQAARTDDPAERALTMLRADIAVEDGMQAKLIDQKGADTARRNFEREATGGFLRRLQNDDPVSGMDFIQSAEFQGSEEERQVWRGHMQAAMRSRVSAELTRLRRDAIAQGREKVARAESAEKDLIGKSLAGGFTQDDVDANKADYSPTQYRKLSEVAARGGQFTATTSDPRAFDELRLLALDAGSEVQVGDATMDFTEYARHRLMSGQLTQGDYLFVLEIAEDRGIGDYVDQISDTIAGNALTAGPAARAKSLEAAQSFKQWVDERTEAGSAPTMDERQDFVKRLVDAAALTDPDGKAVFTLRPLFSVQAAGGNGIDIDATFDATDEAFKRGDLSKGAYTRQVQRIEQFEAVQNKKAEKAENQ